MTTHTHAHIPNGWRETTLGEVTQIKYGKDHKGLEDGNIPCFGSGGFMRNVNQFLYDKPSVLIPRKGTITNLFFVEKPFWTVDTLFYTQINQEKVIPRFLFYKLKNENLEDLNVGSAVPSLTTEVLNQFPLLLPPLHEQKAIADILSSLDAKIELLREQNETLEKTAQTIFQEWFGKYSVDDSESLPEGWRVGKLGEVIEFINGYAFKSDDLLNEDSGSCFKVFKMGHIKKGGGFEESKTKSYIKKDAFTGQNKYILKQGDLLMSMTDMKDAISLLGHTALMIYDNEYVVNQRVGLIRAQNNINIDYPFLYLLTNSKEFISNLRGRANSGVQINLSTEAIKNSEFLIPDKETNKNFDNIIKPMFQNIKYNEIQIQSLSKTRDTLLPKLMSGEVRVV